MPPPRKITILPDFGMSLFPTGDFSNEIVKPDSRIITYKQDDPTGGIHGDILDPTGNEGGIFGDILKPGPFNDRITPDLNSDDPRSGWPGQGYGLGYDEWGDPYTPNGYLAMLDEMKRRRLEEEKERNKEHLNWPVEKKPGYKKYTYDVNYDTDNKFGIKVERDLPCLEEIKEALDSIYYMLFKQSNWGDILPSDDPDHDHNSGHTIMEKFLKLGGCSSALLDFVNCMTGNESKFQETIKSITGDKNNISAEVDENKYAGKYDSNTGNMWINCKAIQNQQEQFKSGGKKVNKKVDIIAILFHEMMHSCQQRMNQQLNEFDVYLIQYLIFGDLTLMDSDLTPEKHLELQQEWKLTNLEKLSYNNQIRANGTPRFMKGKLFQRSYLTNPPITYILDKDGNRITRDGKDLTVDDCTKFD